MERPFPGVTYPKVIRAVTTPQSAFAVSLRSPGSYIMYVHMREREREREREKRRDTMQIDR